MVGKLMLLCLLAIVISTGCKQKSRAPESAAVINEPMNSRSFFVPELLGKEKISQLQKLMPIADSMIKHYADSLHIPGFAYGIIADGKLIHTYYKGYTHIAEKTPVTPSSAFRIASMTKSTTSMAILILRDQGKLNLDEPASKYIKEMADLKYLTADAPAITIRDLMIHRAGFPEDNPFGDRQLGNTDKQLLQLMKDGPSFSNVPGISYEYSNLGFALLGTIITNVSGQPYQQFMMDNIFKPLGMNHTYWDYTKVPAKDLAHGYRWINNDWQEEEPEPDGSWGSMGGLITTIEDFTKYMNVHLSAWPPRNDPEQPPLKRSSVREMHQASNFDNLNKNHVFPNGRACPLVTSYGYGLGITRDCDNRLYIGHGGGLPGFGSYWRIMPHYGLGIVVFGNKTYNSFGSTTMPILDTLLALTGIKPHPLQPSNILEQRKNELMQILPAWKEATKSPIFAENFFPDNPIDTLRAKAETLFAKAGKIKNVTPVQPMNQLRGHFDVEGEKAVVRIFFTLSPETDPKIQAISLSELKVQ